MMTKAFIAAVVGAYWGSVCRDHGWGYGKFLAGLLVFAIVAGVLDELITGWLTRRRFQRESLRALPSQSTGRSSSARQADADQAADAGDRA